MTQRYGINFRSTGDHVVDGPEDTYCTKSDVYPTVRDGITFGWNSAASWDQDFNSWLANDPRLMGFISTLTHTFRFDLPSGAGLYNLYAAAGQAYWVNEKLEWDFEDGASGDVLFQITNGDVSAGAEVYRDAQNTEFTTWEAWVLGQQARQAYFAQTYLKLTPQATTNNSAISHLAVEFEDRVKWYRMTNPGYGTTLTADVEVEEGSLIVVFPLDTSLQTVSSVTDEDGATYTQQIAHSTKVGFQVWSTTAVAKNAANTVTVTIASAQSSKSADVYVFPPGSVLREVSEGDGNTSVTVHDNDPGVKFFNPGVIVTARNCSSFTGNLTGPDYVNTEEVDNANSRYHTVFQFEDPGDSPTRTVTHGAAINSDIINVAVELPNLNTLGNGLIRAWEMDETTGDYQDSLTGWPSRALTRTGTPTSVTGIQGNAADFPGTGTHYGAAATPGPHYNATSMAISVWLRWDGAAAPDFDGNNAIFAFNGSVGQGFRIHLDGTESPSRLRFAKTVGFADGFARANGTVPTDGSWHHIACVCEEDGTCKMYVDGVLQTTTGTQSGTITNSTLPFQVGGTTGGIWNGAIDQVLYWDRPISQAEVDALYNSGNGISMSEVLADLSEVTFNGLLGFGRNNADPQLLRNFPLQESAGVTITDYSQNQDDGTLQNSGSNPVTTTGPNSWLPSAITFDGTDDKIQHSLITLNGACSFFMYANFADALGGQSLHGGNNSTSLNRPNNSDIYTADGDSFTDAAIGETQWANIYWHYDGNEVVFDSDLGGRQTDATPANSTAFYQQGLGNHSFVSTGSPFHGDMAGFIAFSRSLSVAELQTLRGGPEPIASVAPSISGTETVNSVLTCSPGTWDTPDPFGPNGTITYEYQWYRADDTIGTNIEAISGANSSTYTLTGYERGKYVRCWVRASNDAGYDPQAVEWTGWTGAIPHAASYNELRGIGSYTIGGEVEVWASLQDDAADTVITNEAGSNLVWSGGGNTDAVSTTGPNSWLTKALPFAAHYIDVGTLAAFATGKFSLLARVYRNSTFGGAVIAAGQSGPTYGPYFRIVDNSGFQDTDTNYKQVDTYNNHGTSVTTWHSVALTYDKTTLKYLLDGVSTLTLAATTTPNNSHFVIGRLGDFLTQAFDALMCDVVLSAAPYTDAEVAEWSAGPELENTAAPTLSGTAIADFVLSSSTGSWALPSPYASGSNGTPSYDYKWTRSDDGSGTNETTIIDFGSADVAGKTDQGVSSQAQFGNYDGACGPWTTSHAGKITSVSVYTGSAGGANCVLGVYADDGSGDPGALLASGTGTTAASGWVTVDLSASGAELLDGQDYWIAFAWDASTNIAFTGSGPQKYVYKGRTYDGTLLSTWPSGTDSETASRQISGYVTVDKSQYRLVGDDIDHYIRSVVRATNDGGYDPAEDTPSAFTSQIAAWSFNKLHTNAVTGIQAHYGGQDAAADTVITDSYGSQNLTLLGGRNTTDLSTTGPTTVAPWLANHLAFTNANYDHVREATHFANLRNSVQQITMVGWWKSYSDGQALFPKGMGWCTGTFDDLHLYHAIANTDASIWQYTDGSRDSLTMGDHGGIGLNGESFWAVRAGVSGGSNLISARTRNATANTDVSEAMDQAGVDLTGMDFCIANQSERDAESSDLGISGLAFWDRYLADSELDQLEAGPEPVNTAAPTISGTQQVGQSLSCTDGSWDLISPYAGNSNGTVTFAFQWYRADDGSGTNEAAIAGATGAGYTLQVADQGKYIRCLVAATNDGGNDPDQDTYSSYTGAIAASGGGGVTANPNPVSGAWSAVAPAIAKTGTVSPVAGAWGAVAATIIETATPGTPAAAWSAVAVSIVETATPSVPAAAWGVTAPETPTFAAPDPIAAAWSVVAPDLSKAFGVSPVAGAWSATIPTTPVFAAPDPIIAAWSTVAPTMAKTAGLSPVAGAWSGTAPVTGISSVLDPVSGAWSAVAPTSAKTSSGAVVSGAWSTVSATAAKQFGVSPVVGAWSNVAPSAVKSAAAPVVAGAWSATAPETAISGVLDPVAGAWSIVAPGSLKEMAGGLVAGSWSIAAVSAAHVTTLDAVAGAWSAVAPGIIETSGAGPVVGAWSIQVFNEAEPVAASWSVGGIGQELEPVAAAWSLPAATIIETDTPTIPVAAWTAVAPSIQKADIPDNGNCAHGYWTMAPESGIFATPFPKKIMWTVATPTVAYANTVAPVAGSWSAVAPTAAYINEVDPVSGAWSPVAAEWLDQAFGSATIPAASWSIVSDVAFSWTQHPSPVAAAWTTASANIDEAATPAIPQAAWTTVAVTLEDTISPSPVAGSWTTPDPTILSVRVPSPVAAAWSLGAPTISQIWEIGTAPPAASWAVASVTFREYLPAIAANWTAFDLENSAFGDSPPIATWSIPSIEQALLGPDERLAAAWSVVAPDGGKTVTLSPVVGSWGLEWARIGAIDARWSVGVPQSVHTAQLDPVVGAWTTVAQTDLFDFSTDQRLHWALPDSRILWVLPGI